MHIQGQLMLIGVLMVGKDKRLQWVVLGWAVGFVCKRYTQTFTVPGTAVLLAAEKVCDFVCWKSVLLAHLTNELCGTCVHTPDWAKRAHIAKTLQTVR
jgi:hypothetical protein